MSHVYLLVLVNMCVFKEEKGKYTKIFIVFKITSTYRFGKENLVPKNNYRMIYSKCYHV